MTAQWIWTRGKAPTRRKTVSSGLSDENVVIYRKIPRQRGRMIARGERPAGVTRAADEALRSGKWKANETHITAMGLEMARRAKKAPMTADRIGGDQ